MIRISAIDGYTLWADSYDSTPNPLLALEMRTVTPQLRPHRYARAIDVACGTGRWMRQLQRAGMGVAGVDICGAMLANAARNPALQPHLVIADAGHLPFQDASAGLVLCSMALGYLPDLEAAFSEMRRVCAMGGEVLVTDVHPAALAWGWRRSFKADGVAFEISCRLHSLDEIFEAASHVGLRLTWCAEVRLGEPERTLFEQAGRQDLFAEATLRPAILAASWTAQ